MLADELQFGLDILMIGFPTVIIILLLLYLVLVVFNLILAKLSGNQNRTLRDVHNDCEVEPPPEVIAAITAAIAASLESSSAHFTLTSVRKAHEINKWSLTGRNKAMDKRQDSSLFRREKK